MYYVYILKSIKRNEVYVGSTNDLRRRLAEHNKGTERSTKRYKPWRLAYYEAYQSEKDVREREMKLKYYGNAMRELKKRIQRSLQNGGVYPAPKNGAGFTLVELLVVIAIIGVLAAVLLIGINPVEQINKAKDAGRVSRAKESVSAGQRYFTAHNRDPWSNPPNDGSDFCEILVEARELKSTASCADVGLSGQNGNYLGVFTPVSELYRYKCAGNMVGERGDCIVPDEVQ